MKLSLENLKKKLGIAYASIVSNIKHIDKLNLAKMYNSLVAHHLLPLFPIAKCGENLRYDVPLYHFTPENMNLNTYLFNSIEFIDYLKISFDDILTQFGPAFFVTK